jgi:hypothetical protein
MNLCTSCNQDFSSVRAFDSHRTGRHAYTSTEGLRMNPPREDGRRCLAAHEMHISPRFSLDVRGRWTLTSDAPDAPQAVYASNTAIPEEVAA